MSETEKIDFCPICKKEMEDRRHVGVECFYAVEEYVPGISQKTFFTEVDEKGAYFGKTRRYTNGTVDEFSSEDGGKTKHGHKITKIITNQVPLNPPNIRLMEKTLYSQECCKSCRHEFLEMFAKWVRGEFVEKEEENPEAYIPVRIHGVTKMLTREQWDERCKELGQEGREPVVFNGENK